MPSSVKLYTVREPIQFKSYPRFMRWVAVNRPQEFAAVLNPVKQWFDTADIRGSVSLCISERALQAGKVRPFDATATSLSIEFQEQVDRDAFDAVWKPIKAALPK